jgi:mono/diheme cytochrome c family protein
MGPRLATGLAIPVVAAAVLLAWAVWPPAGEALRADPDDPVQVALGARVYAEYCAACHGADLEGEPEWRVRKPDGRMPAPPHDDTGHTWHHPDRMLFEITRYGIERFAWPGYKSDMPAFEGVLSDEEIWAVLAFIKSHWGARERSFQERVTRTTQEAEV